MAAPNPDLALRYKVMDVIGDGAYGCVMKAQSTVTGEFVAIKRMKRKFSSWQECVELREIKSLRKLTHPNIVRLKEAIREKEELFLIFEYCETSLYNIMQQTRKEGRQFEESQIKGMMFQLLCGLANMHKHGFFHRDIKPENLLCNGDIIKIADFGLAREIRSRPPFTEYVSTRWYRGPEILLHSTTYNSPIDLWAAGVLMAELYLGRPLFPGSSEGDQLYKIVSLLGTPTPETWREGAKLATTMNFKFPQFNCTPLGQIITNASSDALALMVDLLKYEPGKRPRADEALQYAFFNAIPRQLSAGSSNVTDSTNNEAEACGSPVIRPDSTAFPNPSSNISVLDSTEQLLKEALALMGDKSGVNSSLMSAHHSDTSYQVDSLLHELNNV